MHQKMKQGTIITRFLSVIFALFIVTYMGYQIWRSLYNPVHTVSAVYVETEEVIELPGLVVRDESVVSYADTSIMEYTVNRGERVAKGDVVAVVYKNDKALNDSRQAAALDTRLKRLETISMQSGTAYDLDGAVDAINAQDISLTTDIENGRFEHFDKSVEDLKMKTLSREYIYRDKSELEALLNDLINQKKQYGTSSSAIKKRITAPVPGYFTPVIDGYEESLNSEIIMRLSPTEYKTFYNADSVSNSDGATVGKIIEDFEWYFVVLTDSKNAERFKSLGSVNLKFSDRAQPTVKAITAHVGNEENGEVLVVFRSNESISEFVSARKLNAEIVLNSYRGLKIPREALRINDNGEKGVYCLIDYQVRFKTVDIIFERDSYYIGKYDTADKNSLVLYDEIIVSAKDLEHRKVLK